MMGRREIDRGEFLALWNGGVAIKKIAAHFQCGVSVVQRHRDLMRLPPRCVSGRKPSELKIDYDEFMKMWDGGIPIANIAKYFKVRSSSISAYATKRGLSRRGTRGGDMGFRAEVEQKQLRKCLGGCEKMFPSPHAGIRICPSCKPKINSVDANYL